jgi:hypothetical protein
VVEGVLLQYGIADRLFAITTDNASNNSTLRDSLEQALTSRHGITWSADMIKINCLAHVLNLLAKALLLGVKVADDSETPDSQQTPSTSPDDFQPEAAEKSVARMVVKVSCQLYCTSLKYNLTLPSYASLHQQFIHPPKRLNHLSPFKPNALS